MFCASMAYVKDNDEIIINKTWDKLHETATKSGYRDGISDGRDKNFQSSFDEGYREGFKNGFSLGLYKGALSSTNETLENVLEKVSRGNCIICKDKSLEEKPIAELIALQTKKTNNDLKLLHNKYQTKSQVSLPEKLN